MSRMNSQPPGGTPLIKNIPSTSDEDNTADLRRLVPAWIISGVVHVVLLSLFLLVTVSQGQGSVNTELSVIESKVDDDVRDKNLVNDEIGNDPDLPTSYNVDRVEEVSVPGPAKPEEVIGVLQAPQAPPTTIPPPPGFGAGSGGGIDDPSRAGTGSPFGTPGGYGVGKLIPGGFGGRSGATRDRMLREGGGNTHSEAAVAAGLKWLAQHQAGDGRWGLHDFHREGKCACGGTGTSNDIAATGLGLLPFLGAGETHRGSSSKGNLYSKPVERGLAYLVSHQGTDGKLGDGYGHPIATIALCEAYGLTADPQLKGPAQRAITACVAWQGTGGGFRYTPKMAGDTSVSGWFIQALKSGQMSGLNVPRKTWVDVNKYMESVGGGNYGETYGYMSPQGTPSMTAVGLLCRQYTSWGPRSLGLLRGVEELQKRPPAAATRDIYYYYYAAQVVHHVGGEPWDGWNPRMRDLLIERQDQGDDPGRRHQKGSWSPEGDTLGSNLGRLGVTALSLLTLEVYYRYLPLYRRDLGNDKDEALRDGK